MEVAEGGSSLAVQGKGAHQLAMGAFVPRVEFHLAACVGLSLSIVALLLVDGAEPVQHQKHLAVELLAFQQQPFVKGGAVHGRDAFQERAAVERDGGFEIRFVVAAGKL